MGPSTNILLIDTSSARCAVGLMLNGEWDSLETESPKQAAQKILPLIQELLDKRNAKASEIDAIGIATGPGSFTGLRVGVGVAQGLASALNIKIVPISNLALLAYAAAIQSSKQFVFCAIKARESEFYVGRFEIDELAGIKGVGKEFIIDLEQESRPLAYLKLLEDCVITGNGAISVCESLTQQGLSSPQIIDEPISSLKLLYQLTDIRFSAGLSELPQTIQPNYVKEQLDY